MYNINTDFGGHCVSFHSPQNGLHFQRWNWHHCQHWHNRRSSACGGGSGNRVGPLPFTGDPNNIIDPRICLVLKLAAYLALLRDQWEELRTAFTKLWKLWTKCTYRVVQLQRCLHRYCDSNYQRLHHVLPQSPHVKIVRSGSKHSFDTNPLDPSSSRMVDPPIRVSSYTEVHICWEWKPCGLEKAVY